MSKDKRRGATARTYTKAKRGKEEAALVKKLANTSNAASATRTSSLLRRIVDHHRLALQLARMKMRGAPMATLMTILVIGVALSLPTASHVLIKNARLLSGSVEDSAQISLFLKPEVNADKARNLQKELSSWTEIRKTDFISRDQALQQFKQQAGMESVLQGLGENPLPNVLVIYPTMNGIADGAQLSLLRKKLSNLPSVELAQLDSAWLERLFGFIDLFEQAATVITIFLVITVILVVGNTIRLLSQNYRREIEISKLVGATDGFVRRPFLYTGIVYGLAGSLIAWLVVSIALFWLNGPVSKLGELYGSTISLRGLSIDDTLTLLLLGFILGLGGAWIAVSRYIREISV